MTALELGVPSRYNLYNGMIHMIQGKPRSMCMVLRQCVGSAVVTLVLCLLYSAETLILQYAVIAFAEF